MSFIIWFKVVIEEEDGGGPVGLGGAIASFLGGSLPLSVSNDPFSGRFIVDAEITLKMHADAVVSEFEMRLSNLPQEAANLLKDKQAQGLQRRKPLHAKIHLGYFEDGPTFGSPDPVLVGAVTSLNSSVNESGILDTTIRGQELAGYRLRTTANVAHHLPGDRSLADFLDLLGTDAKVPVDSGHGLTTTLTDFTLTARNALEALRILAQRAQVPLAIRDNQIFIKNSVGAGDPITLSANDDIVQMDDGQETEEEPDPEQPRASGPITTRARPIRCVKTLGNPRLRVGQNVRLDVPDPPQGTLRIRDVIHCFSSRSGYTCKLELAAAERGQLARGGVGAHTVAKRIRDIAEGAQDQRPAIDVGQVAEYQPGRDQKHRATLNYGQTPDPAASAPSVDSPVEQGVQLHLKPIASPFAWNRCGLVVPVYPTMRALLAHNQGQANDAVVAGFLWSDNPRMKPPENAPGDYWLCLPTGLGQDGQPTGKGVNDLTDATGRRVIQANGLHLVIGANGLPEVGKRPTVPDDLDEKILIEHASGTKITIDTDGSVKIETSGKPITITNGGVRLSLEDASVKIS